MPLIVTPGASNADAYLDVATADALAAADLGAYARLWAEAVTEVGTGPNRTRKEAALRRAAQDVDEVVRHVAARYSATQALIFPRLEDVSGVTPFLPVGVIRAAYRQALYVFANADTLDAALTRRARGLSSFSEPNVGGSLATEPELGRFDPALSGMLQPFLESAIVGWIRLS